MSSGPITSARNPRIKGLQLLMEKPRERREKGLFVVEGAREFKRALIAGFEAEELFISPRYLKDEEAAAAAVKCGAAVFEIPPELYDRLACRRGAEGVIAVMRQRSVAPDDLILGENPLIIVLEGVEKPGNIGAVLRSADAAGADAVLICDGGCDRYNPNLIRSSLGAAFTVQIAECTSEEGERWLRGHGISILTAQLQDSEPYYSYDMTKGTAIVMGTEDKGLSPFWRGKADGHIRIPMAGVMDSLNVSVSAAILCFEAVRQRSCR